MFGITRPDLVRWSFADRVIDDTTDVTVLGSTGQSTIVLMMMEEFTFIVKGEKLKRPVDPCAAVLEIIEQLSDEFNLQIECLQVDNRILGTTDTLRHCRGKDIQVIFGDCQQEEVILILGNSNLQGVTFPTNTQLAVFRALVIYRFKELFAGISQADVCFCRGHTMYSDDVVMSGSDQPLAVAIRSKSIGCELVLPSGETHTSTVPETAQVKDLHRYLSPDVPAAVFVISGQICDPDDYICVPLFQSEKPKITVMRPSSVIKVQVGGRVFSFDVRTGSSFQEIMDSAVKKRLAIRGDSRPQFRHSTILASMTDAFLPIDDQAFQLQATVAGQYVTFVDNSTGTAACAQIPLNAKIRDLPGLLLTATGVTGEVEMEGRDADSFVSEVWKGTVVLRYYKRSTVPWVSGGSSLKGGSGDGSKFPKRQVRREASDNPRWGGSRPPTALAEDDHRGPGRESSLPPVFLHAAHEHAIEPITQDLADPPPDDASRVEAALDLPPGRD
jgi:hypothetical protein